MIYGDNYAKLRESVRALHPAMDVWMITEGYGRTLGRPGLDLTRRELRSQGVLILIAGRAFEIFAVLAGASGELVAKDDLMRRVFFQSVVSMSEAVYDRRMLALTLQQGRGALPVLQSTAAAEISTADLVPLFSSQWSVSRSSGQPRPGP